MKHNVFSILNLSLLLTLLFTCTQCTRAIKAGYDSLKETYVKNFGNEVELKGAELDVLNTNIKKGTNIFEQDKMAKIAIDFLKQHEEVSIDEDFAKNLVILNKIAYYGKLQGHQFAIEYQVDFNSDFISFKKYNPPIFIEKATNLAVAQKYSIKYFKVFIENEYYSQPKICSFYSGHVIEVYIYPSPSKEYMSLAGGLYTKWDESLNLMDTKYLHDKSLNFPQAANSQLTTWDSAERNILNEIDVFQHLLLQKKYHGSKGFRVARILTKKYWFVKNLSVPHLKFNIYKLADF